jgi:uncharacterized membrane protein YcaP (DUF421 family)
MTTSWTAALTAAASAVAIYVALIGLTRLAGLRSFSKMSSFDFAVTVAIGSVIASTAVAPDPPVLQAVAALATLYAVQIGVARLRAADSRVTRLVDNRPVLLMEGQQMLDDVLRREGVTRADVLAKLREANVLRMEEVRAVVLESTGDISVLHADDDTELQDVLLEGVRGAG